MKTLNTLVLKSINGGEGVTCGYQPFDLKKLGDLPSLPTFPTFPKKGNDDGGGCFPLPPVATF